MRKVEEEGPEEAQYFEKLGGERSWEQKGGDWEGKVKEAGERQEAGNHEERKKCLANSVALGRKRRMKTERVCYSETKKSSGVYCQWLENK